MKLMMFVVFGEWKAKDVPKVIETRMKNPPPKELKILAEAQLFGQHKTVAIVDAPDEKTIFKWMVPFIKIMNFKAIPAVSNEESMKIATGK